MTYSLRGVFLLYVFGFSVVVFMSNCIFMPVWKLNSVKKLLEIGGGFKHGC